MDKRPCGKSGIDVSVLSIGCWAYGGEEEDYWGAQAQSDVDVVVRGALDQGINYFDTAEAYNDGRSEESLGKALRGRRGEAVIGTKVNPGNTEPSVLCEHCDASLQRLGTDYIDIYFVHWPITKHSVEDAFARLTQLRSEGKIRAIAVSNFGVQQLTEALGTGARRTSTVSLRAIRGRASRGDTVLRTGAGCASARMHAHTDREWPSCVGNRAGRQPMGRILRGAGETRPPILLCGSIVHTR